MKNSLTAAATVSICSRVSPGKIGRESTCSWMRSVTGKSPLAWPSAAKIGFGALTANVKLADGRGTFEKLEAKGGDAEVQTEGVYFLVQPRMEFAPVFGKAKVKVAEAFWAKSGAQTFKGLADMALASAKGPDGAWSFNVTGSVGHPRLLPVAAGMR